MKSKSKLTASQLRAFRSGVAKLKNKGIVSVRIDARSQKPTRYMLDMVNKKFADVISGNAAVVKVPRAQASQYKETGLRQRRGRVVVPKKSGERVYFDKAEGAIMTTRKEYGHTIRKKIQPQKTFDVEKLPKAKKGQRLFYRVPFNHWTNSPRFESLEELKAFMEGYEKNFPNWLNYVEIEDVTGDADYSDDD